MHSSAFWQAKPTMRSTQVSNTTSGTAVRVRRLLPATPEEVFSAWTDPNSLKHWMSPSGVASATVDLRVGGQFKIVMLGEGMEIEHTGQYREIVPPSRLVFTWQSEYTGGQPTLVTVTLSPEGGQTALHLTHELLSEDRVESHRGGWSRIIDKLASHLEGGAH